MKGFKGFEKGLVCKGKQYAENTVFEEKDAVICRRGMHFCENPFDVLDYYNLVNPDGSFNDFADLYCKSIKSESLIGSTTVYFKPLSGYLISEVVDSNIISSPTYLKSISSLFIIKPATVII